ncbi:MAG: hypothetical protein M3259_03655 [Actinomycetota bacterium]|nr:hypothetical protein [Actinomycetota bacterium]
MPTWAEYWPAVQRERARNLDSAFGKLADIGGGDQRSLSEENRRLLASDTKEQRVRDVRVIRGYKEFHGPSDEEIATYAEKARAKLLEVRR